MHQLQNQNPDWTRLAPIPSTLKNILRTWNRSGGGRTFSRRSRRYARLFFAVAQDARLPERGTSGSVQRGPANPARPGREQRYRDRLGCRRSPGVPLIGKFKLQVVRSWISVVGPRLRY